MKQNMKNYYIKQMKTVGYWSAVGGLEVKEIKYGIDDTLVVVEGAWNGKPEVHELRVNSTRGGRSYITLRGVRYYLDECIRA